MKLSTLLCGVALVAFAAPNAQAADLLYSSPAPQAVWNGGPYFGAKIGAVWNGSDPIFLETAAAGSGDAFSMDTGFTGSIVAGYAFGTHWGMLSPRIEVEAGYQALDVDSTLNAGAATLTTDGSVNSFYWFTNLLLDIPMSGWGFTPFIGGGVGFANTTIDNVGPGDFGGAFFNGEDTTFAWNATAGLSYDVSRNVTFSIAYRFVQFTDVEIQNPAGTAITSDDIDSHQVTFGANVHL